MQCLLRAIVTGGGYALLIEIQTVLIMQLNENEECARKIQGNCINFISLNRLNHSSNHSLTQRRRIFEVFSLSLGCISSLNFYQPRANKLRNSSLFFSTDFFFC